MPKFRAATPASIQFVSKHLRAADLREMQAAQGPDVQPDFTLLLGGTDSDICLTAEEDGIPFVLFGARQEGDIAVAWMVATDAIKQHVRWVFENTPVGLKLLHDALDQRPLWNLVDRRNALHVRWLKWAGAEFTGRSFFQADPQVPFDEFIIHAR